MTNTRAVHICKICGEKIPAGSKVLTINPKGKGRAWVCDTCRTLWNNIKRANREYNNVDYGDEGAAMVWWHERANLIAELYDRCIDDDMHERLKLLEKEC